VKTAEFAENRKDLSDTSAFPDDRDSLRYFVAKIMTKSKTESGVE
jgi:hypothetical protein